MASEDTCPECPKSEAFSANSEFPGVLGKAGQAGMEDLGEYGMKDERDKGIKGRDEQSVEGIAMKRGNGT